ncbi:DNA cytosine methyltransferase [Vallitalea guaymasensis]|uniref:DNA cytosine methyltransferase n=1 Tax=Vallitalea guaymasensis TaxID=1185412 RepID=UPI0023567F78|nr:DNA (cytosine-5-)-methyltransferase [Vallitalea guaymasensis]
MNFLDLFSGAGGLSEGFLRQGFNPIAHIELDKYACETLLTRTIYYYLKKDNLEHLYREYQMLYHEKDIVKKQAREELISNIPIGIMEPIINVEISDKTLPFLFKNIDDRLNYMGIGELDMIIGGPPCQAYSLIGRARDKDGKTGDPRNYLYKLYVRFIKKYKPKAFVFENVPGILTAFNGELFRNLKAYMKRVGYNIEAQTLNAKDFGVLQNRKRVIIIGWRKDLNFDYPKIEPVQSNYIVNDLLYDLPNLGAGTSYKKFIYSGELNRYLEEYKIRKSYDVVTHHNARPHNTRDLKIYKLAVEKWNNEKKRIKYTDLPEGWRTHKNITSFLDRFKVVAGDEKYSHTIVSHISKDGHHYIHPDIKQNRSMTVREAARIQSFPDNYYFEGPRTSNYIQIGNAVPPLMGEKLAEWFKVKLENY